MKVRVEYQPRTKQGNPMKCPPLCFIGHCIDKDNLREGHYKIKSLEGTEVYSVQLQDMFEVENEKEQ